MSDNNNGGGNGFGGQPRVKNAFDITKLKLTGKGADGQSKATLMLTMDKNMPRFVVWTGNAAEREDRNKNYGKIIAALDPVVIAAFWGILDEIIEKPGKNKLAIQNKGHKFFGGQRSERPEVLNTLIVGKDDDGVIWMMVSEKGRDQIRFEFRLPEYHVMMNGDGSPIAADFECRMVAKGWRELMSRLQVIMMADNYVEPPPFEKKGGGGGGNRGNWNNNRGGGNGGGNRGGNGNYNGGGNSGGGGGMDDDIPF